MSLKTYDPNEVSVIIGTRPMSGFADGSFVTIERNEDAFTLDIGSDGEGTRSKSNNRSGTITIVLQQSSESNLFLSELALADELSNGGVVPALVNDNLGTSLYAAETGWIKKVASAEYAREAGSREWIIETNDLATLVGGN